MHLTIDGYGGDRELLGMRRWYAHSGRFPGEINMTKISEPYVFATWATSPKTGASTGFVIIAESHISSPHLPRHGYVWVDIFSCKEFATDGAAEKAIIEASL